MVGWMQPCVLLALVLQPVLEAAATHDDAGASPLAVDDECAADEPLGGCAFHALQQRGRKATAAFQAEASTSTAAVAAAFFEEQAAKEQLAASLDGDELLAYRQRFVDHVGRQHVAGSLLEEKQLSAWFFAQAPALTRQLVDQVAEKAFGWKPRVPDWAKNATIKDLKVLMGVKDDPTLEQAPKIKRPPGEHNDIPLYFDVREKWPECIEAFTHVRDQGRCGSCWAFAAATTMDGRLCIATRGEFSGPRAWISAAYFTSCYNMRGGKKADSNGCEGGNPGSALQAAARGLLDSGGVPTGSPNSNTCVPWFGSGNALDHFWEKPLTAPACPAQCTSESYPRPLQKDKFYPTGKIQVTKDFGDYQLALMEGGPVPFAFAVYKDFMAYWKGYYDRTTDEIVGDHAVTGLGYTSYKGKWYAVAINSWGHGWGDGTGMFKMEASCCNLQFYLPQVGGNQEALPLPGSTGESKTCITRTGGTCVLKDCYESRGPTTCSMGRCICKPGYCSEHGMCVKAKAEAAT